MQYYNESADGDVDRDPAILSLSRGGVPTI